MARKRLWIASPYFVPDVQVLSALKLAVLRGVDVRILIPDRADHRTIHMASFSFYESTIPFGIKLYRYKKGFMHQKVFIVDAVLAGVGTANLDNRSFRLNFEFTILNFKASFIQEVKTMLDKDFTRSRLVLIEEYRGKPFLFRLTARSAKLLSPIL
jgi:cardiolipin synthase